MFRTLFALLGMAIIGAIFAGVYYAPDNIEKRESYPFSIAPGDAEDDLLEPSIPGSLIEVNMIILGGPIDLWVMDQEWTEDILDEDEPRLNLSRPFSYHAQWSQKGLTGIVNLTFVADGETRRTLIFDNSDAYYEDTPGSGDVVRINIQTRYLEEEQKSLILGYIAVLPSVLLVILTLARQIRRRITDH